MLRLLRIFDLFDRNTNGQSPLRALPPPPPSRPLCRSIRPLPIPPPPTRFEGSVLDGFDFDAFQAFHRSLGGDALPSCKVAIGSNTAGGEPLRGADVDTAMREVFRIFDKDRFISARELQRVLVRLELEEGKSLERVNSMIVNAD